MRKLVTAGGGSLGAGRATEPGRHVVHDGGASASDWVLVVDR